MRLKNEIAGGIFYIVPAAFILSIVFPDIVGVFVLPVGFVAAVCVLLIDGFSGKLFKKEQVFKVFFYALCVLRFAVINDWNMVVNITAVVALVLALLLVIRFSIWLDEQTEETRRINKL